MNVLGIVLRRGSAPFAVPLMAALGWYAGGSGGSYMDWSWATGQAQQLGVLLVPLTAAIAAWDVSRDRRLGAELVRATYPRAPISVLINGVGALIAGLVAWVAAFVALSRIVRGGGEPYWSVVLLGPWCLVAAVLVGAAAGTCLPRYLAAPATAAGTWVLLAYGSGSDHDWIARLSAIDFRCCTVASQPVAGTVAGQWLWVAGIGLLAAAVVAKRWHGVAFTSAAALAVAGALVLISLNGAKLTEGRVAVAEACHVQDDLTVCMWPEHAVDLETWVAAARIHRANGAHARLFLETGLRPQATDAVRIWSLQHGQDAAALAESLARES